MFAIRIILIFGLSWLLMSAPVLGQTEEEGSWQEVGAEYAAMIEEEASENPKLALWMLRNIHMEVDVREEAIDLFTGAVAEFRSASLRQAAQRKLDDLKSGAAPWPLSEDDIDEVIWDVLGADFSSESVQSGGLTIRLNFRGGIQLMDGSIVEWTAARRRPYVRAALRWLQVLRGVDGVDEHKLTIDFVGLPVNFCNGFAEIVYEDLREVGDNWIPASGFICINSIFYERGTLELDEWREELFHNALHEMGHILGVGSLWNLAKWDGEMEPFHPLELEDPDYADEEPEEILREWVTHSDGFDGLVYRGPKAVAAFQRVHETDLSFVPISADGGHLYGLFDGEFERQTDDGDEIPATDSELMAHRHVLSEITIGFLDDLGWEVDYGAAESLESFEEKDWQSQSSGPLQLVPTSDAVPSGLRLHFPKEVDVFGVKVLATASTDNGKVLHAAAMMAEYLDNDEDGEPDNELVIASMRRHQAMLLMTPTESDFERLEEPIMRALSGRQNIILQNLFGSETHPNGAAHGVFDAAYEEVLHLVTHAGFSRAYPDAFGEHPGTLLAEAMDVARGGHFKTVPKRYPKDAWYTYYDHTCAYNCQATEYLYWGITSLLGAQDFPGRLDEIGQEWRFNTPEKLKTGDRLLYQLLSNRNYKLPITLPDGKYMLASH